MSTLEVQDGDGCACVSICERPGRSHCTRSRVAAVQVQNSAVTRNKFTRKLLLVLAACACGDNMSERRLWCISTLEAKVTAECVFICACTADRSHRTEAYGAASRCSSTQVQNSAVCIVHSPTPRYTAQGNYIGVYRISTAETWHTAHTGDR